MGENIRILLVDDHFAARASLAIILRHENNMEVIGEASDGKMAIELAKEKVAGFFCLAGVGGHIKGMVKSAKEAGLMISIDGCPVQCAAKTLQHEEIEPAIQIVVTELGIEKSPDLAPDEKACFWIVEKVKEELAD